MRTTLCSTSRGARLLTGKPKGERRGGSRRDVASRAFGGEAKGADKGLGLLEWAGDFIPQPVVVKTSKFAWNQLWVTMTKELAPQDDEGTYVRPADPFTMRLEDVDRLAGSDLFLYTGNACPWCHRVELASKLLGLPSLTLVQLDDDAEKASRGGWIVKRGRDPVFGAKDLREVYTRHTPGFVGRCTAPLLLDGTTKRPVSNNSVNIMKVLNALAARAAGAEGSIDLFPPSLDKEVEEMNEFLFGNVNNAVYQAGFSTTQAAHDKAARKLFLGLERLEGVLSERDYLLGDRVTASDLMLLPTLVRFDAVYAVLFKCSKRRIRDYPCLRRWMQRMMELPGSLDSFDLQEAIASYYEQLFPLNPSGITPYGPSSWEDLGVDPTRKIERNDQEFRKRFHFSSASSIV